MIVADILIVAATFVAMEGVAWVAHRFIMHGFLWSLHEDHHRKDPTSFLEKNDYFFVIFAVPAMLCFALGTYVPQLVWLLYVASGITVYGIAYFFVHDVFIHQRLRFLRHSDNFYLRAIRKAHKMHHKHLGKEEGECFGMLFVPMKYFREALKSRAK